MIDSNYALMKSPHIYKKTGTVVKWYKNKKSPNITVKEVSVGPNAMNSKITKSWLFMNNQQPDKLIIRNLIYGSNNECCLTKTKNGWKQLWNTLKPL